MNYNQLKSSFRNLKRYKLFSIINVIGLAFGLTCTLLISLWIWDEINFDRFHLNGDNIYQVMGELKNDGEANITPYFPSALAQPMVETMPEVKRITRVFPANVSIKVDNHKYSENGIYADSSFLSIFSFPIKDGSKDGLSQPNSIIITDEMASRYFPNESALGKNLIITQGDGQEIYTITAVLKNIPKQSSLEFDFILNYDEFELKYRPWWRSGYSKAVFTNFNVNAYVELNQGVDIAGFNSKLETFINQYDESQREDVLFAYPFQELYLRSDFSDGRIPTGRINYVNILSIIAVLVLVIACINFMNLSTAIASKRAKEVGLRKTIGATRSSLIIQFILESIFISVIAMIVALTLCDLVLPWFNALTGKTLDIPFGSSEFWIIILLTCLMTGIIAGSYPAFYMSSFNPTHALKNSGTKEGALAGLRKALVTIQFSLSMIFITCSLIIYQQIDFITNKDLGIRKENILNHGIHEIPKQRDAYKNELMKIPGVQSVTFSEHHPLYISNGNRFVTWSGKPEQETIYFNVMQVGGDFVKTFEMELVNGTDFPDYFSNDVDRHFIINETAAQAIGLNDPVGMELTVWGRTGKVVGVVRDFHHQSLAKSIEPLILLYNPEEIWRAFISFKNTSGSDIVGSIAGVYQKFEQNYPFEYSFVEDQFLESYEETTTIAQLSNVFSTAAILISCLGLFGLSAFMVEQKRKETGIRKVLGASQFGLIRLFSMKYLRLILISMAFATPIAWLYMNHWLSSFAFRIEIDAFPFITAGLFALIIALITISYTTINASNTNPADTLKYE